LTHVDPDLVTRPLRSTKILSLSSLSDVERSVVSLSSELQELERAPRASEAPAKASDPWRFHGHDEVRIWSKQKHLAFRIATIGAVCVGFDGLPDGEEVRGLMGGDRDMLAHEWSPCLNSAGRSEPWII
jgi:hypothetical protein